MLAGYQKVFLRGLGQALDPAVHVGKAGSTPAVEAQVAAALEAHELVKLRFHVHKDEKRGEQEQFVLYACGGIGEPVE